MINNEISSQVSFGKLWNLVRPYVPRLLLASLLLIGISSIGLIAPFIAGRIVDTALTGASQALGQVVLILIGLFACLGLLSFFEHYLLSSTGSRFLNALRNRLFGHLVRQPPSFYEERRLGELLSRLSSDLSTVESGLTTKIPSGFQATISFIGTLIILLFMHTRLTLVSLAIIPPIILLAVFYGKRLEKLSTQVQDSLAESTGVAEESLSGIRTVQAFTGEDTQRQKYGSQLESLLKLELRNARLLGAFSGIIQFIGFSSFAVVLWYGGLLIQRGELSAGQLTAFLLYVFKIAGSVGTLGSLYTGYRELKGASARVFEILETTPTVEDSSSAKALASIQGRIHFEQVSFQYPTQSEQWALRNINLTIEPGEMVAFVGPSGSGKSTLFALLLRFYDPTSGVIRLDNHDLREIQLSSLRQAIGLVPQDIFLFSETVEENLQYGQPNAESSAVYQSATSAGADSFIRLLPNGYQEKVGEKGVKLSVGQRQRIAIARAFLRDPSVLLLDEATSALDAESEETIQQALSVLAANRTTLVIAHRLATARRADRIFVMDQGQIVGQGTHSELFETNDLYRRYWELQSLQALSEE